MRFISGHLLMPSSKGRFPCGRAQFISTKQTSEESFSGTDQWCLGPRPDRQQQEKSKGRRQSREGCLSLRAYEVMAGLHALRFSTFYSLSPHSAYKLIKWQSSRNMYETDLETQNLTERPALAKHKSLSVFIKFYGKPWVTKICREHGMWNSL